MIDRKPWHDVPVRNPVYFASNRVMVGGVVTREPMRLIGHSGAMMVTTEDGREVTVGRDKRRRWRKRARR